MFKGRAAMVIYLVLIGLPALFSLFSPNRMRPDLAVVYFIAAFIIVALRENVGMDWINYVHMISLLETQTFLEAIIDVEPLSRFVFWIAAQTDTGIYLANIFEGALLLIAILIFARRTPDPWISVVAATPYMLLVMGMSGLRQAMAVAVSLIAIAYWRRCLVRERVAFIIVAALFHVSALLLLALVAFDLKIKLIAKIGIGAFVLITLFVLSSTATVFSGGFDNYAMLYVGEDAISSPGAFAHLSLIWFPTALFLVYRYVLTPWTVQSPVIYAGSLGAVLLFFLALISPLGASRMSLYLYFVPMAVYPAWIWGMNPRLMLQRRLAVIAIHVTVMVVWLLYANNAGAWQNYSNVLFK